MKVQNIWIPKITSSTNLWRIWWSYLLRIRKSQNQWLLWMQVCLQHGMHHSAGNMCVCIQGYPLVARTKYQWICNHVYQLESHMKIWHSSVISSAVKFLFSDCLVAHSDQNLFWKMTRIRAELRILAEHSSSDHSFCFAEGTESEHHFSGTLFYVLSLALLVRGNQDPHVADPVAITQQTVQTNHIWLTVKCRIQGMGQLCPLTG